MAIKNSGSSLSFLEIEDEFGKNSERSLGSYRISDNGVANNGGDAAVFSNLPLDTGIPQSGPIKFSHFYGKRLNVFVDLYSKETTRINAYDRYINNKSKVKVVGEFKNSPNNTSGTRVFIHVNNDVASKKGDVKYVALRTGSGWEAGTILSVDVGSGGGIYGAGGDGGKGRRCNEDSGSSGKSGTSALGIEYNGTSVNLYSGGRIQCGFGGGGGGGGGVGDPDKSTDDSASSGGGGGGGAGLPVGEGGSGGTGDYGEGSAGSAGSDGTKTTGGAGGEGGSGGGSEGADGGNGGGKDNIDADAGGDGEGEGPKGCEGDGLAGGANGSAIRKASGVNFSFNNNGGTILGSIDQIEIQ